MELTQIDGLPSTIIVNIQY